MSDYFQNKLKASNNIVGSYNEEISAYVLKIGNNSAVFKEKVGGWPSRVSFAPEAGVSLNNEYYTFKDGEMWEHSSATRSNFYGIQYDSTITPIFNDAPSSIKNFKTLSYEGDAGWTAGITTDQQDGEVVTWKKKEGLYFNYIKGLATSWNDQNQNDFSNFDTSEFSIQGLGEAESVTDNGSTMTIDLLHVNTSLQIGDKVYYLDASDNILLVGAVTAIGASSITVSRDTQNDDPDGDFIFFVKDSEINTSGIIGYYGSVKMTTDSGDKKELFAVNSEIFISSE